jgi:peptide/nickel transport system permease protein
MREFWERFRKNRPGVAGLVLVGLLFAVAAAAPVLSRWRPDAMDLVLQYQPPSWHHLLGTDEFGRDVLTRIFYGARVVIGVALPATALALGLGVTLGLTAGLNGGMVEQVLMRVIDVLLAFPSLVLAIGLVAAAGPSLVNIILVIGVTRAPTYGRLIHGMVLSLRHLEFVDAARATGATMFRIGARHILPNVVSPLLVYSSLTVGASILTISGLSFLGIGVQPPAADWGVMLTRGREYLMVAPWIPFFPGFAIFLTVMGFNLLGDGLRDALDPRLRLVA